MRDAELCLTQATPAWNRTNTILYHVTRNIRMILEALIIRYYILKVQLSHHDLRHNVELYSLDSVKVCGQACSSYEHGEAGRVKLSTPLILHISRTHVCICR